MATSTAGKLLVATPAIGDGVFDRSVIFMIHHDAVGALGVIVNQASPLSVGELLPRWSDLLAEPRVVFTGGPVEPNGFIGIAELTGDDAEVAARIPGSLDLATLDLEADPAVAAAHVRRLRIFRGYSGWAPGQLDAEISAGAWFILDTEPEDLWSSAPESLCEDVLTRQRGTIRWFANAPTDPTLN